MQDDQKDVYIRSLAAGAPATIAKKGDQRACEAAIACLQDIVLAIRACAARLAAAIAEGGNQQAFDSLIKAWRTLVFTSAVSYSIPLERWQKGNCRVIDALVAGTQSKAIPFTVGSPRAGVTPSEGWEQVAHASIGVVMRVNEIIAQVMFQSTRAETASQYRRRDDICPARMGVASSFTRRSQSASW